MSPKTKRRLTLLLIPLVFLAVFPFLFSLVVPWTDLQCKREQVDLSSGRVRVQRYYWFLKLTETIHETPLSERITEDYRQDPDWKSVNTFSFGHGNSPHYTYHGATGQIAHFERMVKQFGLSEDEAFEIAAKIIELWKQDDSDSAAGEYLNELFNQRIEKKAE